MNIFTAEIKRLMDKKEVRALTLEKEPTWLKLFDSQFNSTLVGDDLDDQIAKLVCLEDHFFNSFPEGKLILEFAVKHLTHLPLFPKERTEDKMGLVKHPPYANRKVLRDIFARTKITISDATTIAEIMEDLKRGKYSE